MSYSQGGSTYRDREDAGKALASSLEEYRKEHLLLLAIPNGGVPVACVISKELSVDLYLMIVRKLQIPDNPEAGFGAVTSDGHLLLNHDLIRSISLSQTAIERQKEKTIESIRKRQKFFGGRASLPPLRGRTLVLVDDGFRIYDGRSGRVSQEKGSERGHYSRPHSLHERL